jgi:hypothetical protein
VSFGEAEAVIFAVTLENTGSWSSAVIMAQRFFTWPPREREDRIDFVARTLGLFLGCAGALIS